MKQKPQKLLALALAILMILTALAGCNTSPDTLAVKLYFVNTATNEWETETRQITANAKRTDMISDLLNQLVAGPKSTTLSKSIPSATLIVSGALVENVRTEEDGTERTYNTVDVTLSDEFYDLSGVASTMCMHAIVHTLTELDFVDDVHFLIGEEELLAMNGQSFGTLNRDNMLLGNTPILPVIVDVQEFIVYFSDDQALSLVAETRSVEMTQSKPTEQYIVEELLKGPQSKHLIKTIPADTKLRSAYTEGDICYVDFSSDFVNKFDGGSSIEQLMVYSIVNSLTELPNVKKVKFLVDGDNILDQKSFHLDLSKPFERAADMLS